MSSRSVVHFHVMPFSKEKAKGSEDKLYVVLKSHRKVAF
jgi:hypothetical protein